MPESIIFAPTLSGRPHLGTACNLVACALVAAQRGARLIRRLDTRDEPQRRIDDTTKRASLAALDEMAELLGIETPFTYTSTERRPRYMELAERMVETGHATRNPAGDIELAETARGCDLVHGYIREYCSNLVFDDQPYSTLVAVADALDHGELVHLRGNDLLADMVPESKLFAVMVRRFHIKRPALCYAHFPLVADAAGVPLHKSAAPGAAYDAATFLQQWPTPDKRRVALARLMLKGGDREFAFSNIRRDYALHITHTGQIIGATPWTEAGMFCSV